MKRRIRRWLLAMALLPFEAISSKGFLKEMGWFRSVRTQRSVDADGKPIPWWSYAFVLFVRDRLHPQLRVFEYGSGNSTLWLAPRVHSVLSIEADKEWYERIGRAIPQNVELKYQEYVRDGDYCRLITQYSGQFDVIIVDAVDRVRCAKNSVGALTPSGVIIFDDAHQEHLREGPAYLAECGFRRLDFFGTGPQQDSKHCTSLFYRDKNCLGV